MSQNITACGVKMQIGEVTVTNFADDAQPFTVAPVPNAGAAMTLASNMMVWRKDGTVKITVNVTPDSEDDADLYSFFIRERQKMNTMKTYPGFAVSVEKTYGFPETFSECVFDSAPYSVEATQAGRWKAKAYTMLGFIDDSGT